MIGDGHASQIVEITGDSRRETIGVEDAMDKDRGNAQIVVSCLETRTD